MFPLDLVPKLLPFSPGACRVAIEQERQQTPSIAAQQELKNQAARISLLDVQPRRGVAWFPFLWGDGMPAEGGLAWVSTGTDDPFSIGAETRQRVEAWLMALAGVDAQGAAPFSEIPLRLPLDPGQIDGRSLELACAIALLSHQLQMPPQEVAIASGQLGLDPLPTIDAITHADAKARICDVEAPGQPRLIVANPTAPDAWLRDLFGHSWRRELCASLQMSPPRLALDALRFLRDRKNAEALRAAEAALHGAADGFRGLALLASGACWMHRGHATLALERIDEAQNIFANLSPAQLADMDALIREEAEAFLGIALLDSGHVHRADHLLLASLQRLRDHPLKIHNPLRWRHVTLQVAGSLRRVRLFSGQAQEACALQREEVIAIALRDELARCYTDLAETLRILGDHEAARMALRAASDALPDVPAGARPLTERFLRIVEVRVGERDPRWTVAPPRWDDFPQPVEVLETLLQQDPGTLEDWGRQHIHEPLSFSQRIVYLSAGARALRRHGLAPAWLNRLCQETPQQFPTVDPYILDAIVALEQRQPDPWLKIAPY